MKKALYLNTLQRVSRVTHSKAYPLSSPLGVTRVDASILKELKPRCRLCSGLTCGVSLVSSSCLKYECFSGTLMGGRYFSRGLQSSEWRYVQGSSGLFPVLHCVRKAGFDEARMLRAEVVEYGSAVVLSYEDAPASFPREGVGACGGVG